MVEAEKKKKQRPASLVCAEMTWKRAKDVRCAIVGVMYALNALIAPLFGRAASVASGNGNNLRGFAAINHLLDAGNARNFGLNK